MAALLLWTAVAAGQSLVVEGVVRDSTGAAVTGAQVELQSGTFTASQVTDSQGSFVFQRVPASKGTLTVRASGFADAQRSWDAGAAMTARLEIALTPGVVEQAVVVTATRTPVRLSELAVSAVALGTQDLDATAALTADDKLRQIPGFTLFRRSGSRTANPTSQGVSLSGLGASGASRAVVLEDGVPLTDPFGGWVYWGRVPQEGLQSIELVRRGISSLYGSDGLGGAVQFVPREDTRAFSLEMSYGNENTPDLSLWSGMRFGAWDTAFSADLFHTDGYVLVPTPTRGTVDANANSEHAAVEVTLGRHFGERTHLFGRGQFFTEGRNNGTLAQINDTQIGQGVLGADTQSDRLGALSFRVFGQPQAYDQTFSSVPIPNTGNNRNSERLTNIQHVPAQELGASAWWSKVVPHQTLVAGLDAGEVMGWSDESSFSGVTGAHTTDLITGGRQRTVGVYGQDIFRVANTWILTIGGRYDHWRNFDAQRITTTFPAAVTTAAPFADISKDAFSPRISLLHTVTSHVSLTASMYRAFRAPTLNELYRSFRVGNIVTQSNPGLDAERLTGAEIGANVFALNRKLNVRGNFFWDDIVDPIANVTLNATSNPIQRQRQNLGRTRSRGVELDAVAHLTSKVEVSGGYQFVDATVLSFPADPANNPPLTGLQIPQIPRHQFTLQARYWNPSVLMLSVQGRYVGDQFDDDQNTFVLGKYFSLDLFVGRSLGHGVEIFGAAENATNQRYDIAKTPTPNVGPPILARVGVRWNFPRRD